MLRLKKTQEKKEEVPSVAPSPTETIENNSASEPMQVDGNSTGSAEATVSTEEEGNGGISLLGIGGKQVKGGAVKKGKKRTPGELRIQKGTVNNFRVESISCIYWSFSLNFR